MKICSAVLKLQTSRHGEAKRHIFATLVANAPENYIMIELASPFRHPYDTVCCEQLLKWDSDKWQIHHNNAPTHSAQLMQQYFAKHSIL
jgi:hypothetical protein